MLHHLRFLDSELADTMWLFVSPLLPVYITTVLVRLVWPFKFLTLPINTFCPQLADGVFSEKVSCPLGVLLVISESSPDALVQVKSVYSYCGNWNEKYHFDQIRGGFSLLLTSYNFVNRFLH